MSRAPEIDQGEPPLDTRLRILHAAADLFAEKGFHGASLREIAGKVGIRTPSLFYHFKSKGDLYLAVMGMMFGDVKDLVGMGLAFDGTHAQRLENLVRQYAYHVAQHRNYAMLFFREILDNRANLEAASRAHIFPVLDTVASFIREGQAAGEFRAVDPIQFIFSVIGMTVHYYMAAPVVSPLSPEKIMSQAGIDERVEHIVDMVRRGLLKD